MSHLLAKTFFFLPAIMGLSNCVATYGDDPAFKITKKRSDDKVDVKTETDKALFSVHSPRGISDAIIERGGNRWPTNVVFRLYLKGLEQFKVTSGKITLEGAVSSHDGNVRLWRDGKEDSLLEPKNPSWMKVRMIGRDGKPVRTIPLKDGYFEMQLPKVMIEDNPKSITLHWIDFYR